MGAIERAKIYILKTDGTTDTSQPAIDVCFNPKEYSIEKSLDWEASKAHEDAPVPEFKTPKALSLSVTLQFDTYEERVSVRDKYVRRIEKLTFMTNGPASGESDVKKHAPPRVMFCWGKMTFRGVINSLSQKYTMFLSDGTPVRAEVALKMQQVDVNASKGAAEKDGVTNLTAKTAKTCQVNDGDRLDSIASKELGDASRWHEIADLNGIDDPFKLKAGTLALPDK
jgi:Contractile injection system tube protein